jgi:glycosyltransferase involved in cell wall biosynthesis
MSAAQTKHVLYHFRTKGTGAEGVHIAGIAKALEKLGYSVRFVSPTGNDPRQTAGENPFQTKAKKSLVSRFIAKCPDFLFELLELAYNLFAWRKISRELDAQRPDFIYERHAFFLCITAFMAGRRKIPLVIEVNELVGDLRIRKQPLLSFIARWTDRASFRRAALIIVVSPHLKKRIVDYGIPSERVLILPNAVAAEDHVSLHNGEPLRQKLGLKNDHVLIGFIGWFVEWHRLDLFLKVFAKLHREQPNVRLALVGEGRLKEELQGRVRDLAIETAVFFVPAVPHHEVPSAIAAFDVAVVPHSNEYRSPIKLFEYMAEAKATLSPRTEPIKMIVEQGKNGMLFEPLNEDDCFNALQQLARDAGLRTRLGSAAREHVLSNHTWAANARRVLVQLDKS